MAKTIIVKTTCDRCKEEGKGDQIEGDESVFFVYDGYSYGLDLCAMHAEGFHNTIQGMIAIAATRDRVTSTSRRSRTTPAASPPSSVSPTRSPARRDKEQLQAIRDWANSNGYKVSNRGRISADVQDAYHTAFQRKGA